MSIGKSSIQRAANNGYSKVQTSAPDMMHSEVVEEVKGPESASVEQVTAQAMPKKACANKKARKTPGVANKSVSLKSRKTSEKTANKAAEKAVALGDNMPYYLL